MTGFIEFRDKIRQLTVGHERVIARVWNFVIALAGILCINANFGYQQMLSQTWVGLALSVICAFLPIKGLATVVLLYGLVHLAALSTDVAVTALVMVLVMLAVCGYFRAKNTYNLMTVPVCYQLGIPYAIPLGAGFLRNMNELTTVVCGAIVSYFLKMIRENASLFLDASTETSALGLIQNQMLTDQMFYFYMAAMIAMFLVVYMLRSRDMNYAWLIASISGILAEFVIMMTGYLLVGNIAEIPALIVSNIVLVVVGFIFTYFILDVDYSRVERVQFEDDEYYYYVTAVPKVKMAEEEKHVKKITEETQSHGNIRRGFGRKGRK